MNSDSRSKSAKQIAREFWCSDHRYREPEGVIKTNANSIICWRIGWALGVHEVLAKNPLRCDVLRFFENIESRERWQCGRKSASSSDPADHAKVYDPVVFKQAAWLLGWFDGYREQHEDVNRIHKDCKPKGHGKGKGRYAAKLYLYKLDKLKWKDDPEIKRLLGIPSDS